MFSKFLSMFSTLKLYHNIQKAMMLLQRKDTPFTRSKKHRRDTLRHPGLNKVEAKRVYKGGLVTDWLF